MLANVRPDAPPPEGLAALLKPHRVWRKRLATVCLFLVITIIILGLQVYATFNPILTIALIALAALFAWRANRALVRFGWVLSLMPKVEPFEKHVGRYEEWFERHRLAYESELEALRALLPEEGKGIEIGVGTGRFAAPLGVKLGIDPSRVMLEIARQRGVQVVAAVAEALPLREACLDFALMVTTICFVDDLAASFKEAYRVLKPDGVLIIGFVDRNSPLGMNYQKHKAENVFYREANFYSVDEVVSHLKKVGFGDFNFTQTIFHDLSEIRAPESVKGGYGEGSFVAVRTMK